MGEGDSEGQAHLNIWIDWYRQIYLDNSNNIIDFSYEIIIQKLVFYMFYSIQLVKVKKNKPSAASLLFKMFLISKLWSS